MNEYTGHKNLRMHDGKTLANYIQPTIENECRHFDVEVPSEAQIAIVISALRMHTIIVHAANYDFSELGNRNQITKYWPIESSIGRYFRDTARETLDHIEQEEKK